MCVCVSLCVCACVWQCMSACVCVCVCVCVSVDHQCRCVFEPGITLGCPGGSRLEGRSMERWPSPTAWNQFSFLLLLSIKLHTPLTQKHPWAGGLSLLITML